MKHSDVTISIITHHLGAHVVQCFQTALEYSDGANIILTANGSPGAEEYFDMAKDYYTKLRECHPVFTVVKNTTNEGFIAPSNHAFGLCKTPFFVLLNDDAVPPSDWLDKMKTALEPDNTIISGPNAYQLDANFVGGKRGTPPDYIEASCMMVKADEVRPHGLFSDYLSFAYAEDADLCLRMRSLGYDIAQADFTLFHRPGTTSRTVPHLHDAMRENFAVCKEKWAHYLKTRTFA